jgi:hypothetical protein
MENKNKALGLAAFAIMISLIAFDNSNFGSNTTNITNTTIIYNQTFFNNTSIDNDSYLPLTGGNMSGMIYIYNQSVVLASTGLFGSIACNNLLNGSWCNSTFTLNVSSAVASFIDHSNNATGGNITEFNGYRYHNFTSNGTFIPERNMTVEYIILGGGGGGGYNIGGGGGAGCFRNGTINLINQVYNIIVGSGGIGATTSENGQNGSNSSFAGIIALFGGGGGSAGKTGSSGCSGGGGDGSGSLMLGGIPLLPSGFGNNGGSGIANDGGGGGSNLSAGQNGISTISAGSGANGTTTNFTGISMTVCSGAGGSISVFGGLRGYGYFGAGNGGYFNVAGSSANGYCNGGGGGGTISGLNGGSGSPGMIIIRYPVISNYSIWVKSPDTSEVKTSNLKNNIVNLNINASNQIKNMQFFSNSQLFDVSINFILLSNNNNTVSNPFLAGEGCAIPKLDANGNMFRGDSVAC